MKIDGNRSSNQTDATQSTEAAQKLAEKRAAKQAERAANTGTDSVQVSSDAKLMSAAVQKANEPTPIRTDKVEEMKRKLANGEIGTDAGRLADRIIDDLLKE